MKNKVLGGYSRREPFSMASVLLFFFFFPEENKEIAKEHLTGPKSKTDPSRVQNDLGEKDSHVQKR